MSDRGRWEDVSLIELLTRSAWPRTHTRTSAKVFDRSSRRIMLLSTLKGLMSVNMGETDALNVTVMLSASLDAHSSQDASREIDIM